MRPISQPSNNHAERRDTISEAVVECEACARPARPTRSLRAPHRHDFDARAFTRALYASSQNHTGPATCSRAPVGSPASNIRSTASLPPHQPRQKCRDPITLATLQDAIRHYSGTAAAMSRHIRYLSRDAPILFTALHSLSHACDGAATANGLKNQRFVGRVPAA